MASKEKFPLYCKVCSKSFSGPVPAQQHYSSGEHKKKEENRRRAPSEFGTYCHICNISCDTPIMLERHNQSPRHLAMVERQAAVTNQSSYSSANVSSGNTSKEYTFDGSRGYCHICSIDLTSRSHAQDHLKGKSHAKRKTQIEATKNFNFTQKREPVNVGSGVSPTTGKRSTAEAAGSLSCQICNVCFSGSENAHQHYSSDKHKKKEELSRLGNTQALMCNLCAMMFTCVESQKMHEMSDKHKRKVKEKEKREKGELLPLRCEVCNCGFTGQENAEAHFKSAKHKRNYENKMIQVSSHSDMRSSDQHGANTGIGRTNFTDPLCQNMPCTIKQDQNTLSENQHIKNNQVFGLSNRMANLNIQNQYDMDNYRQPSNGNQKYVDDLDIKPFPLQQSNSHPDYSQQERTTGRDRELHLLDKEETDDKKYILSQRHLGQKYRDDVAGGDPVLKPFGQSSITSQSVHEPVMYRHTEDNERIQHSRDRSAITDYSVSMVSSLGDTTSVDSFSQSDQPVRFIKNDLKSSMPTFGRGRYWHLQNTNPLIGKLLNLDKGNGVASTGSQNGVLDETTVKKVWSDYKSGDSERNVNHCSSEASSTSSTTKDEFETIEDLKEGRNEQIKSHTQNSLYLDTHQPVMSRVHYSDDSGYGQLNISSLNQSNDSFSNKTRCDASHNKNYENYNDSQQINDYRTNQPGTISTARGEEKNKVVPEYTFDPFLQRGKCNVCDIELTSTNHMTQHTTGKKHAKAAIFWKHTASGSVHRSESLVCTLCNATFAEPEAKDEHDRSEEHIMKENLIRCGGQLYYCDICKVPCTGEVSYNQHLMGAQHRKMAGATDCFGNPQIASAADRTIWYPCNVCKCNLNSETQLLIHEKSPSHLALARVRNLMSDEGQGGMLTPGFNADRTNWYPCNVCRVNLNSAEQLRIHELSPNHLSKLEKSGNLGMLTPTRPELPHLDTSFALSNSTLSESGPLTPLQSFLSQELFPEEFMPKGSDRDMVNKEAESRQNETSDTGSPPFKLCISNSPVPFQERYATATEKGKEDFDDSKGSLASGGCKRGQGSDIAWATRNRGSGDWRSEPTGLSKGQDTFRLSQNQGDGNGRTDLGARPKYTASGTAGENPYAATHPYFCHTCKSPMNTKESYESHLRGKRHMQKVCTEPAPNRIHHEAIQQNDVPKTVTSPRNYQTELFQKALKQDILCFLPTGTGKTLVSVMVISTMLEKYPSRNVLFLVDKVLLVLQQANYIKQELEGSDFLRYNPDSESCRELNYRKIQVAAVCMGQQNTQGIPLWKHDVVVVTAAFCQNLLDKEILRWTDFSLVVFDEAHHCEKSHPFNSLLKNYHSCIPIHQQRPKILGLTASPAGKADVPKTIQMLESLILNMGGVVMTVVEEPANLQTLKSYQSNAELVIIQSQSAVFDTHAMSFQHELHVYIMHCYLKLLQVSDIRNYIDVEGIHIGMSSVDIKQVADGFIESNMDVLQSSLFSLLSNQMEKVEFSLLTSHVRGVCMALSSLLEGGTLCMLEEFGELGTTEYGFKFADKLGLPCEILNNLVRSLGNEDDVSGRGGSDAPVEQLLRVLTNTSTADSDRRRQLPSISLVLVKQRGTAHRITKILQNSAEMRRLGLNTTTVVGHGGGGSGEKGMSVNQQKRVLEDIKEYKYQIIIATSVAEEGVDWPECERVISMYPPSTVTALVQMRGRARKKNSKFIVLCASPDEEEKLIDIMNREQNMIKATQILVDRGRQQ